MAKYKDYHAVEVSPRIHQENARVGELVSQSTVTRHCSSGDLNYSWLVPDNVTVHDDKTVSFSTPGEYMMVLRVQQAHGEQFREMAVKRFIVTE